MTRPLSLVFAFTLLALPIACGDDDGDDEGTGGSSTTGGTTAKGGSGGTTTGGTAGKGSGGSTGGSKASAGAGAGGEAGGTVIVDPAGGTAGAGGAGGVSSGTGGSGGVAGDPGSTVEGGTAGATVEPTDGGVAGANVGGAGGAAEPTLEELVTTICSKEPGGDACTDTTGCAGNYDDYVGTVCTDELESVGMALLACWATLDDDEFSCVDDMVQYPDPESDPPCLDEYCQMAIECGGATEDDLPVCFP